ncbi:MAG TPA: sn-glycerol-3-phosphate ABC transporter ATP-binding protein UgpC [Phycisphaerales bacterium]|nr:sn-glycerol-3-phosphate ABC transporter ATP-binding protein UgpC [Phycisphaerales bacterium]
MAQVTLREVRKTYENGYEAVKGVSLDIRDGEFIVLVGPSGCGKSTTLRMVAGLEEISGGTIAIGERVVNEIEPKDRDIAMVFQNYALYPHMTAYQNMAFALKLRKTPKDEIDRRVREAARMLHIESLLEKRPKEMSGGQRQRVAVGRAIVREPKCFLFDEPLSNLDAKLRVTTRAELKALHQRLKTTTIYVTHDQEEAMTLGDRIVVMAAGEIQQAGPPLEVYRTPVNRFVASFIGTPPMNFIDGVLEENGGAMEFASTKSSGLRLSLPAHRSSRLKAHARTPVVMGVRPQSLSLDAAGAMQGRATSTWPLAIRVVEPLGDSMDVTCDLPGGGTIVARVPARDSVTPGSTLPFGVDAEQVHFFEPGEFGKAL